MRILAGIPTHRRTTAPAVAVQLSRFVDDVAIVAQDTELPEDPRYRVIYQEPGLCYARNTLLDLALRGKYDALLQCDDDVRLADSAVQHVLRLYEELGEKVGFVSSQARLFQFWESKLTSNKDYLTIPSPRTVYALNEMRIREAGYYELETMEDIEYALRLWKMGYPTVRLSLPARPLGDWCYTTFINRNNKTDDQGGQSIETRQAELPRSLAYLTENYDFGRAIPKGNSYSWRYNWEAFRQAAPDLGFGYIDSRRIRL